MPSYRNALNTARATTVERAARVGEAGEVFTPTSVVNEVLAHPLVAPIVLAHEAFILEPAAGDGNFLEEIYRMRLAKFSAADPFTEKLSALGKIYGVELQSDNVALMRKRLQEVVEELLSPNRQEKAIIASLLRANIIEGSLFTPEVSAKLPDHWDLIVGNPPYNPKAIYKDFTTWALSRAKVVSFVLPTTWKLAPVHEGFRRSVTPRLAEVKDLPWGTFSIKLRTSIVTWASETTTTYKLNGEKIGVIDEGHRLGNSLLSKAYAHWPDSLMKHKKLDNYPLYVGWKCNVEGGKGRVNALQSLAFTSEAMPHNHHKLYFASEEARLAAVSYLASPLAAYFQSLVERDSVALWLPLPPPALGLSSYEAQWESLGASEKEKKLLKALTVFHSAKAHEFFKEQKVTLPAKLQVGSPRKSCSYCGSASFHRKGCSASTEKEKLLRDL